MAKRKQGPAQTPREFLSEELRLRRAEHQMTQAKLAELLFCAESLVAQIETGARNMRPELAKQVDAVFQSGTLFHRLALTAQKAGHVDYFADAVEAEQTATSICHYAPTVIPGLLQTADYANAVTWATDPCGDQDAVAATVRARLNRAQILREPDPRLWVIMHETALRMVVGGPTVMADQLRYVTSLMRGRRAVVQVVPFTAGPHAPMGCMASIMSFIDAPDVAYVEGPHTGQLIDEPGLVAKYTRSYDLARAVALSPEASLTLIESAAEDYERWTSET
ncbi:Scr1 family TA system antitoxin-like transcriptional regulator [Streptomyces sp. NPDC004609]|uniref:helix-turn-helix domain-containing protein n=1 Tax=Streptomyces sp. NPDC004609 TaxID=3364704 RepID=UPI0036CDCE99